MCGIFGIIARGGARADHLRIERLVRRIARISESRGRDSSGFAVRDAGAGAFRVLRAPLAVTALVRSPQYREVVRPAITGASVGDDRAGSTIAVIGHSRLVTNGTQLADHNNQPVVRSDVIGVHNGIVVNEDALWAEIPGDAPAFDIDTEALLALFAHARRTSGDSGRALRHLFDRVEGSFSVALMPADRDELVLGTNTGSLYLITDGATRLVFASERRMLAELQRSARDPGLASLTIEHVEPRTGRVVGLADLSMRRIPAAADGEARVGRAEAAGTHAPWPIHVTSIEAPAGHRSLLVDFRSIVADPRAAGERALLQYDQERLARLRRCSVCVLPDTFPFIAFDGDGRCNYCRNYVPKNQRRPIEELKRLVAPYRSADGSQDCIVPFSGGRDSTFALHMIKNELGMNPITITYDWGMVTDLARRNIARVCGKLGVENVIVAADIKWKRDNIRKNISAWLKRPRLGMVPLLMSGDKYFFYHTNRLKQSTGIKLNVWGINRLENTDFKTGFAGVAPKFDKRRIYSMSLAGHLRFWGFVASNVMANPAYLNASNLDSIGSIISRYLFPQRDYYSFFDYYAWNEQEIESLILREYDWEKAIDTDATWRIGDGTASFYNYVYLTVAGFSENDTFRSNQIREGLLTRAEALARIERENAPRYENIKWYLEIVGLDYADTIRRVNAIPRIPSPGRAA